MRHFAGNFLRGVAAFFALAIAAAPVSAQNPDWPGLISEAQKEGKLTVYNGTNYRVVRMVAAEFTKKYGIRVDVLDARTTEIRERIRVEQATNRTVASLTFSGWTTLSLQQSESVFRNVDSIPNAAKLQEPLKSNGVLVPTVTGSFALAVNTTLVKPEDEPKSWHDLADPKWKGKILSDDPRAAGAGNVWFEATYNAFGAAFHEKINAQIPVFSRIFPENQRRLARGEFSIYIPFAISEIAGLRGLPVKAIIPVEGAPYVPFAYGMLRDAPAPNAAHLFINFSLDDEAQAIFASEGFSPAIPSAREKVPADVKALVNAKLLGTTTVGRLDEMVNVAKGIYK